MVRKKKPQKIIPKKDDNLDRLLKSFDVTNNCDNSDYTDNDTIEERTVTITLEELRIMLSWYWFKETITTNKNHENVYNKYIKKFSHLFQ